MIPAKEAKEMLYTMFAHNYLHLTVRCQFYIKHVHKGVMYSVVLFIHMRMYLNMGHRMLSRLHCWI